MVFAWVFFLKERQGHEGHNDLKLSELQSMCVHKEHYGLVRLAWLVLLKKARIPLCPLCFEHFEVQESEDRRVLCDPAFRSNSLTKDIFCRRSYRPLQWAFAGCIILRRDKVEGL